jgi:hypothetical protein
VRKPHIRFREFFLITTLASLVAAAYAIRARTTYYLSAQDHASRAYQARVSVKWWEDRINEGKRYLETWPVISEEWAVGRQLRLMPAVKDPDDIPTRGNDLVVVADVNGVLYFRIFDGDGKRVLDWAEGLYGDELKKRLVPLWPPHELTGVEKRQVITAVSSILSRSKSLFQAQLKTTQALHAKAVAEAEHHERLARSYGP